jgi:hypothetical protein
MKTRTWDLIGTVEQHTYEIWMDAELLIAALTAIGEETADLEEISRLALKVRDYCHARLEREDPDE